MRALTIAAVNLRRLGRDRVGLFFIFVFPVVLILLLGVSFGGEFTPTLGVVSDGSGKHRDRLVSSLEAAPALAVEELEGEDALVDAVERGLVDAGLVIPRRYDDVLRSRQVAQVRYVARPGDFSDAVRASVESAVAEQAALVRAARFAMAEGVASFDQGLSRAERIADGVPGIRVTATVAGDEDAERKLGRFELCAATQLVLFIFVNSLAGSVALIQSRRLGVSRRMLSTPTRARTVLLGEAAGRFGVAMLQALFIVAAAALLFGVDWGDPLAAGALVVAFCLVSTGAAMLFGAALQNEQQAGALVPFGLGLAALGGCMVPLEVFSPTMERVAHVTPHAWAVEGFTELIRRDARLVEVLPQIGVLAAFAAALLAVSTWRLRRTIVG